MKYYHIRIRFSPEESWSSSQDHMEFDISDPDCIREKITGLMTGKKPWYLSESCSFEISEVVVLCTSDKACRWVDYTNRDYCNDPTRWDELLKRDLFTFENKVCNRTDVTELVLAECRASLGLPSDYDLIGKTVCNDQEFESDDWYADETSDESEEAEEEDSDTSDCETVRCDPSSSDPSGPDTKNDEENGDMVEEKLDTGDSSPKGDFRPGPDSADLPRRNNKVFIVHGHDGSAVKSVKYFLLALGLEPVILAEEPNAGMTVIDKIEAHADVGYGVVLYTPCDAGFCCETPDAVLYRARQNVVFEHGYLIARIGRKNVCALYKGDIERPSDMAGVVFERMDENDGWRAALAQELQNVGYRIDPVKLLKEIKMRA